MRKLCVLVVMCGVLSVGSASASEKVSDFKEKALDLVEKTRPALESGAFEALQKEFKEKQFAARFLEKGAYTAKFVSPKDKKEYFLTAVPMVSYFPTAAPPLAGLVVSDGEEFRAASLDISRDRRGKFICNLLASGGKVVAKAETMELLKEPPLPVSRGKAAIAIARNPEGDDIILLLCRSPYAAKGEGELECLAVVFYSGDLAWDKFVSPSGAK